MQVTSAPTPWQACYYPIPKRFCASHLRLPSNPSNLQFPESFCKKPTLSATNRCSQEQEKRESPKKTQYPFEKNHSFSQEFCRPPVETQNRENIEETYSEFYTHSGIYSNMWWGDLKAAIGQRINLEGIASSIGIMAKDKHLVIPHVAVPDIRYIDWAGLKRKGFEGVVFDKDNTITAPYSLILWPPLGPPVELCKSLFGDNIAVFSNSAGNFRRAQLECVVCFAFLLLKY